MTTSPSAEDAGVTPEAAAPSHEQHASRHSHNPLAANMVSIAGDATSSTFATLRAPHSVFTGANFFNSLLHNTNLECNTFHNCEMDGSLFEGCSLRGVELRDCDVEGLIINGVRIGALLKLFMIREHGQHAE